MATEPSTLGVSESAPGKIVFLNRYFYPDHSATSQLLSDLAFHLAGEDLDIHVITSRMRYDDAGAVLPSQERVEGVSVHRIWTTRFGRGALAGRAVDYLTFYISAAQVLWRLADRRAVVVAKTDPPLISVVAAFVSMLRGAKLVNWLQDLFPEVAVGLLGKGRGLGLVAGLLRRLRDWSLRRAVCNVVLGDVMRERLDRLGIPPERICVIHNWADGKAISPVDRADNPLRWEWGLEGNFVVGYSGNLGRAHEFSTVIGAVERLRDNPDIVFLFIGGGAQMDRLMEDCRARGLGNVMFMPYQPRERLKLSLGVADAHLAILQPQMEGLIVPSKFYGIAAAGRPTLFVGDAEGEIPRILREAEAGYTVSVGDSEGLAKAIERLAGDEGLRRRLGSNARAVFEARFDRRLALEAWRGVLAAPIAVIPNGDDAV